MCKKMDEVGGEKASKDILPKYLTIIRDILLRCVCGGVYGIQWTILTGGNKHGLKQKKRKRRYE